MSQIDNEAWKEWVGQIVVVDTNSTFVYLGTLAEVRDHFILMKDVDVHDRSEGSGTKEKYVMDAKTYGIKPNRKEVSIRKSLVVSVSRLGDIIEY